MESQVKGKNYHFNTSVPPMPTVPAPRIGIFQLPVSLVLSVIPLSSQLDHSLGIRPFSRRSGGRENPKRRSLNTYYLVSTEYLDQHTTQIQWTIIPEPIAFKLFCQQILRDATHTQVAYGLRRNQCYVGGASHIQSYV